jgi:hypothetical protein
MSNQTSSSSSSSPRQALLLARIIWGAMLGGLVMLLVVAVMIGGKRAGDAEGAGQFASLTWGVWALLAAGWGVGTFVRGQIFKRHWVGEVVTPTGFIVGSVVSWAMVEGPTMLGLVLCIADGLWPHVWVVAGGIGLMVLMFPSGRVMMTSGEREPRNPYQP